MRSWQSWKGVLQSGGMMWVQGDNFVVGADAAERSRSPAGRAGVTSVTEVHRAVTPTPGFRYTPKPVHTTLMSGR